MFLEGHIMDPLPWGVIEKPACMLGLMIYMFVLCKIIPKQNGKETKILCFFGNVNITYADAYSSTWEGKSERYILRITKFVNIRK